MAQSFKTSGEVVAQSFKASGGITAQSLNASGRVTAQSFDARSDRRLKTDLITVESEQIKALDIVDSVPIYTYYMKSDAEKKNRCLGMMAQDIEKYNIDDFSFVDFDESKDEYRNLKESKLVYLLWKGMQELDQKYKDLEEKYNNLLEGKNNGF